MKNIAVFPSRSKFIVKLIGCIDFGSASSIVYLNLLQLTYNFFWNKYNLVDKQLSNYLLDLL